MKQIYGRPLALIFLAIACWLSACTGDTKSRPDRAAKPAPILQILSTAGFKHEEFDRNFLAGFGQRNGIETQFVPNLDPVNVRLNMYRRLFRERSTQTDLLQIDVVWPGILADDLVDLRPYLNAASNGFSANLLASYTVRGRLVALPVIVDVGLLYYRPDLLEKYGFRKPPATWEELERMAIRIQEGERRAGNKGFWGYTWQGGPNEGLTCNALEWQASAGGGVFLEPSGVNVANAQFASALRRAAGWIGTISPPGEFVYNEADSQNFWNTGQAAFTRDWASSYGSLTERPGQDHRHFAVAPLPGGPGGRRVALGGTGIGVSRYAANREIAIKALLEMTDEANDFARMLTAGGMPTHEAVRQRSDVKSRSLLLAISPELVGSIVARPSVLAGDKYGQVSEAYAEAVNLVLRRKAQPERAMADLEKTLMRLTGLPARRH